MVDMLPPPQLLVPRIPLPLPRRVLSRVGGPGFHRRLLVGWFVFVGGGGVRYICVLQETTLGHPFLVLGVR